MIIKRKIPAFTLMEVTISMLIAAIAIAITYTAYHIISGTYQDYIKKQDRLAGYTVADKLLKRDFLLASQILRSADGLQIQSKNSLVSYEFKEEYILRAQAALRTDTFALPVKAIRFTFENNDAEDGTPVDQLGLEIGLEGQNISLIYKKKYSAQDLFK